MINFIVVDDNKLILSIINYLIDKTMQGKEYEYRTFLFNDYDEEFYNATNEIYENKIYILDIEISHRLDLNGIDVARDIYKKDRQSKIIFISLFENKYSSLILRHSDVIVGFISKKDDFKSILPNKLINIINLFENMDILSFKDGSKLYKIPMNIIYYIEVLNRKTIIHTNKLSPIETYVALSRFLEMLNENFVQTHKSCIVNNLRVVTVDKKKKIIYFDNNTNTNLLSKKFINNLKI